MLYRCPAPLFDANYMPSLFYFIHHFSWVINCKKGNLSHLDLVLMKKKITNKGSFNDFVIYYNISVKHTMSENDRHLVNFWKNTVKLQYSKLNITEKKTY